MQISESDLVNVLDSLLKEHPELNPPLEKYRRPDKRQYWYDFTFHYRDTNEDVQIWIRETDDPNYTIIALVALYPHVDASTPIKNIHYGDSKEINRDYGYYKNKKEISKFENKIVALIKERINKR